LAIQILGLGKRKQEEKMKTINNKLAALSAGLTIAVCATACSTASTVNYNLSKDANEFNVYRKITVTNARTDTIMLQAEGYMSLSNNSDNELVVTIKTGEDKYYKDYIYLNDWTCYVMEQTEPKSTDKYHYELVFYPERLVPDIKIE
jgi:hypothetical protein